MCVILQGLLLSLRIEREKHLKEIFRVGAAIRIQSEIRRYLVKSGYYLSHPSPYKRLLPENENEKEKKTLKQKVKARLKVFLIEGR